RVVYDRFNDRWIAFAATDPWGSNSTLLIGVSRTANPTNFSDVGWNLHQLISDTNYVFWADMPSLGFNKDWIVAQVNMICITNTPHHQSKILVFSKTNLYAGNFTAPTTFLVTNSAAGETVGNEAPA